jgi:hypothetical protein
METILFLAVSYGISNIIVHGSIFEGMRNFFLKHNPGFFGVLFTCMICLPTWVGFILSYGLTLLNYTHFTPFGSIGLEVLWLRIFLDGCLTSGVVWFIHTLQEYLEKE